MKPTILKQLQKSWIEETLELMSKQRPKRRYFHFDPVIKNLSTKNTNKVFSAKYVEKHSFLPLLQKVQKTRLYKKDPVTGRRKPKLKPRPISYASHFDALIYSWYSQILELCYEELIEKQIINESVIAYRSIDKKSNIDFAKEVFDFVVKKGDCVTIALDIRGFYDNIDHELLKKKWCFLLSEKFLPEDHYKVFKSITKYAYVDAEVLWRGIENNQISASKFSSSIEMLKVLRKKGQILQHSDKFGIPQGTPISCVLSNLYMYDFDLAIGSKIKNINGLYRRYSDDIIVVCDKRDEKEMLDFAVAEVKKLKLTIQESKTEINYFTLEDGILKCTDKSGKQSLLQYLGLGFDGQNYNLRHKGFARFERNMTYAIRKEKFKSSKYGKSFNKHKIYERFSHFGSATFLTYAKKVGDILGSDLIAKQISPNRIFKKIKDKINKKKT